MSASPLPPSPIPAPPLPEGGVPLVACDLGYQVNGQSGLGYPYGYGSDVCVPVDPCLVDGMLYLDYTPYGEDGLQGSTLYTIQGCSVPAPVEVEDTVAEVAVTPTEADPMTSLPETGGELTMGIIGAVLVAAGGLAILGSKFRRPETVD